jgi:hypothetical protein
MIGKSRAAVGLHERVGFRTGKVALLPTDPAQQEAKRATVIRVGVIAPERPGGVRGLCEEQTRAIRTSSPPLMRHGHRRPPPLNKMMLDLFSVSHWAFRSSSAHLSPLRSSQAMPAGVTRSAGTAARVPPRPSRLGSSPSPSSTPGATSGSSTRPSTRSPVALTTTRPSTTSPPVTATRPSSPTGRSPATGHPSTAFAGVDLLNAACGRAGSGSPAQFVLDCPADPRR